MGTHYVKVFAFLAASIAIADRGQAQCATVVNNGAATNMFTQIRNSTNPVAADKALNSIVFIHRNNATAFGGNSGQLRYDVSFNAGATWTNNLGVLNPLTTNLGRYPNIAIYNPTNNITPSNAYVGYMAATIDPTTSAWNGVVSGVMQLNGTGNTENYNQPVLPQQLIPHSVVKGAPGVFWAVDAIYNGSYITGFTIYKGTWNTNTNAIVWANNFTVTPNFNTGFSTVPQLGDYNIGFDPTGTYGWFSFLGHVSPGPSNYALYPVFYKTVNGGNTWTGPFQVNLNNFSCMTGNLASTNVITTNFEHDLAVDVNGDPHLFTTVCNGSNAYGVYYTSWHHMYDITQKNGLWVAYDVANVLAGRGSWGTSPNIVTQDMAPQVARSADGTKLFFTWTDNSTYSLGQANLSPNLYGKGYNVTSNTWTGIKDITSCNSSISGSILFPHLAPEVLEPSSNLYKLAPVYALFTTPNDPAQIANFNFLDNVTFASSEFTVSPPPSPTISIAQGTNVLLCPNSTISINLSGTYGQALWSTGSTAMGISISNPTITTYSVIAQQSCNVGTASITVTTMSISASGPSQSFCDGSTATLNVGGNAITYTWTPGNITGTSAVVVTSTAIPVYTVTASSNANCVSTATVGVNVLSLPTVSISGSTSVCIGSVLSLTASGAATYTWDTGPTGAVVNFTPTASTSYTVTGEDANACIDWETINVTVLPTPTVTAISNQTVICVGGAVAMTAVGAINYTWSTGSHSANTTATPVVSTVYSVTGEDANLCTDTRTIGVTVNPLPQVQITTNRPNFCQGEKAVLTVSGAVSYTWNNGNGTTTLQITPSVTTVYSITGKDANGCINTATFSQVVNPCLGLTELNSGELFSVYPNPNQGHFTISAPAGATIVLRNQLGQTIMEIKQGIADGELNMTNVADGIYFASCVNKGITTMKKVVVSR